MKLWTLQHHGVASNLAIRHVANWQYTSHNFRAAYRWMTHHLSIHLRSQCGSPPVWCWHSCDGKWGRGPTVHTAHALVGDWDYFAWQTRVVELDVPDAVPLLSSYWAWNELLDQAITTQATPASDSDHASMFHAPLFRHADDDIQAVIPWIEPEWVVNVRSLPSTADAALDPI